MKNKLLKIMGILMLFISIQSIHAQNLNEHTGVNITFSTTDSYENADAVANNFREFNAWRNATYGAGYKHENPSNAFPKNWPTTSNSDIPQTQRYKYNFDPNYGKMYKLLSKNGNSIYPAITAMHQYLTTNAVVDNYSGKAQNLGYSSKQSLVRKPVPHVMDTLAETLTLASNESYTSPSSYRFFGEYLGYLSIVFGQNDLDITKNELYLDGDDYPFVGKNQMQYIEYINEPDAWWTWSSVQGYYQPDELATAVSVAYDGHGGQILTDIYGDDSAEPTYPTFECGTKSHAPNLQIVSPGLHEMNIDYLKDFLSELDDIREQDQLDPLTFDVFNFHHYSSYSIRTLKEIIGTELNPEKIVEASLTSTERNIQVGKEIVPISTTLLEAAMTGSNESKIWIHPELDGYKLRGEKLRAALNDIDCDPESEIWVSEWGYPSVIHGNDSRYHNIDPETAQARWLVRGFMEYHASGQIDKSYWHWYKDDENTNWDSNCGLVDAKEDRKLSWYYMNIMNREIGDKSFHTMRDIDNCGENFAWAYDIENLVPEKPKYIELSCPRIYQYNGNEAESYEDDVWTIWIPTAGDLVPEQKTIYIEDVMDMDEIVDLPTSFSITTLGNQAQLKGSLDTFPILIDAEGKRYIKPYISDEPIFIHFQYSAKLTTDIKSPIQNETQLNLYPNPAHNFVNIQISNLLDKESKIVFTDVLGKTVLNRIVNPNQTNFRVEINLSKGIYFCSLIDGNGILSTTKLVVLE